MSRVHPLPYDEADPRARAEWDRQVRAHGRMTNMKRTLAHSPAALEALMQWYPLRDEVAAFLGDRLTNFYVHAISSQTDCLICSTFFRRLLIDAGENPDALELDEKAEALIAYGRQLAQNAHQISDALYQRLTHFFSAKEIVALTGLGAMMVATNLINNALQVDLDDYLVPYRKGD